MSGTLDIESKTADGHYARRHLVFGWWSMLAFVLVGVTLEALHGLKVAWYLDPAFETRRLLFTLGHAHGVLLGLVNLGFAATLVFLPARLHRLRGTISPLLIAGSVALPAGFLLGGISIYEGDPGLPIALVPVGATLLIAAIALTAWSVTRQLPASDAPTSKQSEHASPSDA